MMYKTIRLLLLCERKHLLYICVFHGLKHVFINKMLFIGFWLSNFLKVSFSCLKHAYGLCLWNFQTWSNFFFFSLILGVWWVWGSAMLKSTVDVVKMTNRGFWCDFLLNLGACIFSSRFSVSILELNFWRGKPLQKILWVSRCFQAVPGLKRPCCWPHLS